MKNHISYEVLDRFASRTATAGERKTVVRHLIRGCLRCQGYLQRCWPSLAYMHKTTEIADEIYDDAFDRALERALLVVSSTSTAPGSAGRLLTDLETHPPQRQETLVRNHPRYWSLELCDLLLAWSHEVRFSNTGLMRHRARLAVLIGAQLEPTTPDEKRLIEDGRARAWAGLGNALRVSGDLNSAEQALAVAQDHLENGNGDEALRAHLLSQLASLRFDQRRFEASLTLIKQVVRIWRGLRNPLEVARALTKQAIATGESGKPKTAVQILLEAGRLIDSAVEPRLALIILHSIIRFHVDGGHSKVALQLFVEARQLYERESDPLIRIKALWLEGQILSAEGHLEPAIRQLSTAREGFLDQGNRYEAAIVSLDLAAGFAKLGRFGPMRELAGETMHEMEARGVQREAVAALVLLMQAANSEVALLLIRRAARALRAPQIGVASRHLET